MYIIFQVNVTYQTQLKLIKAGELIDLHASACLWYVFFETIQDA